MMICKITEDDHTNDHHHYLRYIVTVIFYNVHLMTSRAALEAQRRRLRGYFFSFEYFQRSPTRSMARDDILEPDKQTKNKLNHWLYHHCERPPFANISKVKRIAPPPSPLLNHHLRSPGTSIETPINPYPSSHNRCSSTGQSSWEGGEGSPGCCTMEEGDHRRSEAWWCWSSGNNERLHKRLVLFWSHLRDRKSSTGMIFSILRQLGELLDKTTCIIPATLCCYRH